MLDDYDGLQKRVIAMVRDRLRQEESKKELNEEI